MIKFFRKIRYDLMGKNKTGKYFKYAIGEIILVVIGILIALQINIWNQSRKEKAKEIKYLTSIKSDLIEQLQYINIQKEYELSYINAANPVIDYYNKHSRFSLDTVFFENITILNSRKTFITTDPTFIDLVSSGNINLIHNDILKKKIISYYQELELAEKIIQNNNTLITDQEYSMVMHRLGYYYYPNNRGYLNEEFLLNEKVKKSIQQTKSFNENLAETAKKILSKPENQLHFLNALNHRHIASLGHYQRASILEKKTNELIKELENHIESQTKS
jgi:hypothetical protein